MTAHSKLNSLDEHVLVQLVSGAKTVPELKKLTNAHYAELLQSVRQMVLEKQIERKKGFPTQYRLSEKSLFAAKKLRAKLDMSDLLTDPCEVVPPVSFSNGNGFSYGEPKASKRKKSN